MEETTRTEELQHTNKIISIDEDPLHQSFPDSDMSEGGESTETQKRGSPSKQTAPGGQNAGTRK
jgi:hypothetical protein